MFNKGNVDSANRFVPPDFIYHAMGEDVIGIDKFKACIATDHTTFRDIHFAYIDGVAEGKKVATTWILEGIQQEECGVYRLRIKNWKLWELSSSVLKAL